MEIRNIAIIAHVDHGKTTLTDALMKQTGMVEEGFTMDTNALEQERGITIYAKNGSILYKNTKINIVDTPGHADFGSEVERVLRAIDTVLLLVDAQEGPMPQTRFVLKKSLELGLKPIVVINKIDKPAADPHRVHEEVLELFIELGANSAQIDFPVVYAIGRQGIAKLDLKDESKDLTPLLDLILKTVPPSGGDKTLPLRMQPFNLAYDNFLGRMAVGKIEEGTLILGSNVFIKDANGILAKGKITKIFTFEGMKRVETEKAEAGDIVMIAGLPTIYIGQTICSDENSKSLPAIGIDEPTISLNFMVNDSPLGGRDGKFVTTRQIRERLERELETNVGLKVDFSKGDYYTVYGRGELHISVLLEQMRREGFEIQVSEPKVIIKEENGQKLEPFEEVLADVRNECVGDVVSALSSRKGLLMNQHEHEGQTRLTFEIPTRGLLGYRNEFIISTKGEGILSSRFVGFKEHVGEIERHDFGSMISMMTGKAVAFALWNLEERGVRYIEPGDDVYEGMIIGSVTKGDDFFVKSLKISDFNKFTIQGKIYISTITRVLGVSESTIKRWRKYNKFNNYLTSKVSAGKTFVNDPSKFHYCRATNSFVTNEVFVQTNIKTFFLKW
jgi:GTP-binding protein